MNKDEVMAKLDVNKDGYHNLDDILAMANGSIKKAFFIGLFVGACLAVPATLIMKAIL